MDDGTLLAAVDLGSNSYRLEIGRLDHGQVQRTEYLKETVRQGAGLDADRNLTPEAMQRGWDCLARFGERLSGLPPTQVRAVATQTLREARNRDEFLERARQLLGFRIDVISGHEEARLIYQGVAHLLPQSDERRLVVDIGGRSTELILGSRFDARVVESFRVGSVSWSQKYFPAGEFTQAAFERAEVAAKAVLDEAQALYPAGRWDQAYGSSGTIGAVADVLRANGWATETITRAGLEWLKQRLLEARSVERLRLEGIKDDRRPVIGGGLSVLLALFDLLQIDNLKPAQGALRHGALYDLIDREDGATDVRHRTVRRLATRFGVDAAQAGRVDAVAAQLLAQLRPQDPPAEMELRQRKLAWAAQLHEIGNAISHDNSHKHGAYILENADAAGFSQPELRRLSRLVLGHRGKVRKLELEPGDTVFAHQLLALRLAVILCHARRDPEIASLRLDGGPAGARLTASRAWSAQWPQSAHLLREESIAWQKTPWSFDFDEG